jgi:DNA-binding transcriptional ArsR family regulator
MSILPPQSHRQTPLHCRQEAEVLSNSPAFAVDMSQSTVSQHLRILGEQRFVFAKADAPG